MTLALLLAHAGEGHLFSFEMPPLHPILVNFTAGLIPTSLVADVLGRLTRRPSLHNAAWWMLLFGTVATPLTAAAGWLWLQQMSDMDMPTMTVHQWLGTALAAVFVGLAWWRWRYHRDGREPGAVYVMVAALVVAALVYQGHLGGGMSFGTAEPSHAMRGRPGPPDVVEGGPTEEQRQRTHSHDGPATRSSSQPTAADGWSDYIDVR